MQDEIQNVCGQYQLCYLVFMVNGCVGQHVRIANVNVTHPVENEIDITQADDIVAATCLSIEKITDIDVQETSGIKMITIRYKLA